MTWEHIYDDFSKVLCGEYRSDPDRIESLIAGLSDAMQLSLDKLRKEEAANKREEG